jgi:hypothetical protein
LKAFEDGIRGFSPSPPRLSSISSTWSTSTNRVEDFLLVLTPPPCTELVVHPHHGGWPASYVVRGVGNQIRLPWRRKVKERADPSRRVHRAA